MADDDAKKDDAQKTDDEPKTDQKDQKPLTTADVQKLIKSETDRIRTEYAKRLKDKDKEIEDLQKAAMDEKDRAEFERQKREEENAQRERDLALREVRLEAVKTLDEAGLSVKWADLVAFHDAEKIGEVVKAIQVQIQTQVDEKAKAKLKELGVENPNGGGKQKDPDAGRPNPWKKDTWNLTEQGRILRENPELARKLQATA
jgi:hypothetical protein